MELAATIGQKLLSDNNELTSKVEQLDEQLAHAEDKVFGCRSIWWVQAEVWEIKFSSFLLNFRLIKLDHGVDQYRNKWPMGMQR